MRFFLPILLPLLLAGGTLAEDAFEESAFMGAEGEAAMDGAIAYGYALAGRVGSLTVGAETTTVLPGDQFAAGCDGTSTHIGAPTLPTDGHGPDELTLTTVVLGDVVTLDMGCQ